MDLLTSRQALKEDFISKKQAARANIALVKAKVESLAIVKERELKELQEEFREIDAEFKELGVLAEREELFEGAKRKGGAGDPGRMNNSELLGAALDIQKQNKDKLKEGLQTVVATKETAMHTAAVLEQDREKIGVRARRAATSSLRLFAKVHATARPTLLTSFSSISTSAQRISTGLDEVDSELAISRKLLTNFVKRMYTDKIIIAFTFLIVVGIVGIIVYAALNPGQNLFNASTLSQCTLLYRFWPDRPKKYNKKKSPRYNLPLSDSASSLRAGSELIDADDSDRQRLFAPCSPSVTLLATRLFSCNLSLAAAAPSACRRHTCQLALSSKSARFRSFRCYSVPLPSLACSSLFSASMRRALYDTASVSLLSIQNARRVCARVMSSASCSCRKDLWKV